MNIKGLDYNTQRKKLLLPEYGREIQNMVDYAVALPNKEERLHCAKTIVKLMQGKLAPAQNSNDFEQALWDHLYLMSGKQLDIDWPYDVSNAEKFLSKPQPLKLPQQNIRMRHYGKLIEQLFEKLKTMPEGPERDALAIDTANQMKRDLVLWGHGSIEDAKVADDLEYYTDGIVKIDLNKTALQNFVPSSEMAAKKGKKRKN
ncbi:MAG: DUF4290 domain-containing protein [Prevotella sp.]|nr:DUF4290 domain-containing protein [Prevotella sp.]